MAAFCGIKLNGSSGGVSWPPKLLLIIDPFRLMVGNSFLVSQRKGSFSLICIFNCMTLENEIRSSYIVEWVDKEVLVDYPLSLVYKERKAP